jgi:hypothetical protein
MIVTFKEEGHIYESIPAISWTSVTKVVHEFTQPFDERKEAIRSSQNHRSKWFGMNPDFIQKLWKNEKDRSTTAGSWWHLKREQWAINKGEKLHRGKIIKVLPSPFIDGVKVARDQRLEDGIYPEHLIYNEKIRVCGQSDLVFVSNGYVDISDYKTNKEIKFQSYVDRWGVSQKMLAPVSHLDDCNFYHYALQLSIYMKLILIKNPHLKAGKLELIHVNFGVERYDEYGFPILKKKKNAYICEKIVKYPVPYLEKEAIAVLKYMQNLGR